MRSSGKGMSTAHLAQTLGPVEKVAARKAYASLYDELNSTLGVVSTSSEVRSQLQQSPAAHKLLDITTGKVKLPDVKLDLAKPSATLDMIKILESTDALETLAESLNSSDLASDPAFAGLFDSLRKTPRVRELAKDAAQPGEDSDAIKKYYESIVDIQVISGELRTLAEEASGNESSLWDRIQGVWESIRVAVSAIHDRISGIVSTAARSVLESLDDVKDSIGKGLEAVGKAVDGLAHRFYRMVLSLIGTMFSFAADVSSEANKKGFDFRDLSLEFPSLEFDFLKLATFSIPIPKSVIPKLTVSYTQTARSPSAKPKSNSDVLRETDR